MPDSSSRSGSYGSLNAVLPLLEHLEAAGLDVVTVLDRAGIPGSARQDTRTRLPKRRFERLWRVAVEATGDPALALRVSTRVKPSTLGIVGYLASASESRRNAFELVRGLTPLLWEDFECDLESDGEVAFMRFRSGARAPTSRFTMEYSIGLAITMSRHLGAARSDPLEARFSHAPPAYADEYERILRLPVRFAAGEDGVLFPIALLDSSNPSADAALRELLQQYAADQLARVPAGSGFAGRVRAAVRAALPLGAPSAELVAGRLAMSDRTLRRRLREEGTTYQAVLDDVRAELARVYLAEPRRGIEDVAHRLGFSDASAFTKAFRRWTGRTPAEFVRIRDRA